MANMFGVADLPHGRVFPHMAVCAERRLSRRPMEPIFDATLLSPLFAGLPYDQEIVGAGKNFQRLDEEAGILMPYVRV